MKISIKPEFAKVKVAFGKSGKPLGQRDDLLELAIIARESGNKNIINYFSSLPKLSELRMMKAGLLMNKIEQDHSKETEETKVSDPVAIPSEPKPIKSTKKQPKED